jgi:twitching motility protein PilT
MARIDDLFALQHDRGASDLHLFAGSPPALRVRGDREKIADESLDDEELREMLFEILSPGQRQEIEETGDLDFGTSQGIFRRWSSTEKRHRCRIHES